MLKIYQEKTMARHPSAGEYAGLGEYLRATRIGLGLDLPDVVCETKISAKNIQAMEENNFAALPAEVFTRGFYSLYAQTLSLDCREVLQMYLKQRPHQGKSGNLPSVPATKMAQEVGNMAERPTLQPFSFFGLTLLLLLFFGGFLCWYFSWNPASYLSQKLRSLEEPQRIEQISANTPDPEIPQTRFRISPSPGTSLIHGSIFNLSYPTTATASVGEEMNRDPLPSQQKNQESINAGITEKTRNNIPQHLQ